MASYAGLSPWASGFKATNKRNRAKAGVEWNFSSGYRYRDTVDTWIGNPDKFKTKTVTYNGRKYVVPDADYEDFFGFHTTVKGVKQEIVDDSELGKYIEKALIDQEDKLHEINGVGHIKFIDYNARMQVMRVFFVTDGAVVVFLRVPKEIFGELQSLGDKTMIGADGKQRHLLGIKFWDYVRIRGTKHGTRYDFRYQNTGTKQATKISRTVANVLNEDQVSGQDANAEMRETLDIMARRQLTGKMLENYRKLKTTEEKYRFMRSHGLGFEEDEE
jgi:hypothetical protein